ncbi:hypothetical protein HBB16_09530 [Pseudonocardia sp. MCCB 268]|nr:hypothetical protein [Pseudonocardia cytotoxica]
MPQRAALTGPRLDLGSNTSSSTTTGSSGGSATGPRSRSPCRRVARPSCRHCSGCGTRRSRCWRRGSDLRAGAVDSVCSRLFNLSSTCIRRAIRPDQPVQAAPRCG